MAAAACFLALAAWTDNRALQREVAELQEQRRAALEGSRESDRHRQTAEAALALERDKAAQIQAELDGLRAQPAATVPAAPSEERRAVRARVYAGRQALGDAWVLQGGTATNEAGLKAEPAVLLDESILRVLRAAIARSEPAQAAPREVTVNYNYPAQTPYAGWYPTWFVLPPGGQTNGPPSDGVPQEPPSAQPPRDDAPSPSGIWRPTQKPFLPNPSAWPIATPPQATRSVGRSSVNQPVARPPATQPISRPQPMQPVARPPTTQPGARAPFIQPTPPVTMPGGGVPNRPRP